MKRKTKKYIFKRKGSGNCVGFIEVCKKCHDTEPLKPHKLVYGGGFEWGYGGGGPHNVAVTVLRHHLGWNKKDPVKDRIISILCGYFIDRFIVHNTLEEFQIPPAQLEKFIAWWLPWVKMRLEWENFNFGKFSDQPIDLELLKLK